MASSHDVDPSGRASHEALSGSAAKKATSKPLTAYPPSRQTAATAGKPASGKPASGKPASGQARVAPFTLKGHPTSMNTRWVAPFLKKNLALLEASLGVTIQRTPSGNLFAPLGYGKFGVALATTDGRVVKVTTDNAEPVVGLEIQAMQHASDPEIRKAALAAVVRIDRIVRFPGKSRHEGYEVEVYAILRDGLTPSSEKDKSVPKSVLQAINAHWDGWETWFILDRKKKKTAQDRAEVAMAVLDGWEALDGEPQLASLATVQRQLWNLGIPHMDIHMENLGWREIMEPEARGGRIVQRNELVLFDLGGSYPLGPKDLISPVDGDEFTDYYPWKKTLDRVPMARMDGA